MADGPNFGRTSRIMLLLVSLVAHSSILKKEATCSSEILAISPSTQRYNPVHHTLLPFVTDSHQNIIFIHLQDQIPIHSIKYGQKKLGLLQTLHFFAIYLTTLSVLEFGASNVDMTNQ
jgi:hypothetical protein